MIEVYSEIGSKRVFVGAIDWPGWCRSGRDEASALQALLAYGPRYAEALRASSVRFTPPRSAVDLRVGERLKGGSTTDFGAPQARPKGDERPMDTPGLKRSQRLLKACWHKFDAVASGARGKRLRTGPRGGGRTLQELVDHVVQAEVAYIGALGWWEYSGQPHPGSSQMAQVRDAALQGMLASAAGKIPTLGPRGGKRWPPRYFVRRAAWHVLDHAWEIEDRLK